MGSGNTELKIFIFCLYFEWNANNEEAFILLSRNAVFMGKGSRNLHASLVVEIKLMDFRDIVTRYLAGSCNGIHEYREKKAEITFTD